MGEVLLLVLLLKWIRTLGACQLRKACDVTLLHPIT